METNLGAFDGGVELGLPLRPPSAPSSPCPCRRGSPSPSWRPFRDAAGRPPPRRPWELPSAPSTLWARPSLPCSVPLVRARTGGRAYRPSPRMAERPPRILPLLTASGKTGGSTRAEPGPRGLSAAPAGSRRTSRTRHPEPRARTSILPGAARSELARVGRGPGPGLRVSGPGGPPAPRRGHGRPRGPGSAGRATCFPRSR